MTDAVVFAFMWIVNNTFTIHYMHPSVFLLLSSHAPSHGVNYACHQPFLPLFRPCMLHCGSCQPKGSPCSPGNTFLSYSLEQGIEMHIAVIRTQGQKGRAYLSNLHPVKETFSQISTLRCKTKQKKCTCNWGSVKFILASSDQRMCSQYSSGFFSCSLAKYNLAVLCQRPRKGNFLGRCP